MPIQATQPQWPFKKNRFKTHLGVTIFCVVAYQHTVQGQPRKKSSGYTSRTAFTPIPHARTFKNALSGEHRFIFHHFTKHLLKCKKTAIRLTKFEPKTKQPIYTDLTVS